ncbi:MAG: hypothetical protein ACPHK8_05085, partial [Thermoplasmatota archaeon]
MKLKSISLVTILALVSLAGLTPVSADHDGTVGGLLHDLNDPTLCDPASGTLCMPELCDPTGTGLGCIEDAPGVSVVDGVVDVAVEIVNDALDLTFAVLGNTVDAGGAAFGAVLTCADPGGADEFENATICAEALEEVPDYVVTTDFSVISQFITDLNNCDLEEEDPEAPGFQACDDAISFLFLGFTEAVGVPLLATGGPEATVAVDNDDDVDAFANGATGFPTEAREWDVTVTVPVDQASGITEVVFTFDAAGAFTAASVSATDATCTETSSTVITCDLDNDVVTTSDEEIFTLAFTADTAASYEVTVSANEGSGAATVNGGDPNDKFTFGIDPRAVGKIMVFSGSDEITNGQLRLGDAEAFSFDVEVNRTSGLSTIEQITIVDILTLASDAAGTGCVANGDDLECAILVEGVNETVTITGTVDSLVLDSAVPITFALADHLGALAANAETFDYYVDTTAPSMALSFQVGPDGNTLSLPAANHAMFDVNENIYVTFGTIPADAAVAELTVTIDGSATTYDLLAPDMTSPHELILPVNDETLYELDLNLVDEVGLDGSQAGITNLFSPADGEVVFQLVSGGQNLHRDTLFVAEGDSVNVDVAYLDNGFGDATVVVNPIRDDFFDAGVGTVSDWFTRVGALGVRDLRQDILAGDDIDTVDADGAVTNDQIEFVTSDVTDGETTRVDTLVYNGAGDRPLDGFGAQLNLPYFHVVADFTAPAITVPDFTGGDDTVDYAEFTAMGGSFLLGETITDLLSTGDEGSGVDTVVVTLDGVPVVANGDGDYEIDLTNGGMGYADGDYDIVIVATDAVGNQATETVTFTLDIAQTVALVDANGDPLSAPVEVYVGLNGASNLFDLYIDAGDAYEDISNLTTDALGPSVLGKIFIQGSTTDYFSFSGGRAIALAAEDTYTVGQTTMLTLQVVGATNAPLPAHGDSTDFDLPSFTASVPTTVDTVLTEWFTVIVDGNAPDVAIVGLMASNDYNADDNIPTTLTFKVTDAATLSESGVDESSLVLQKKDGNGNWQDTTAAITAGTNADEFDAALPALGDGTHEYRLRAEDNAGNVGTGTVTLNIDQTLPMQSFLGIPASLGDLVINITDDDAYSTPGGPYEVSYTDSDANTPASQLWDAGADEAVDGGDDSLEDADPSDGLHVTASGFYFLRTSDSFGNEVDSAVFEVLIDLDAPAWTDALTPADGGAPGIDTADTMGATVMTLTFTDNGHADATAEVFLDGASIATGETGTFDFAFPADGDHSVQTVVTDAAGNVVELTAIDFTMALDPVVTVTVSTASTQDADGRYYVKDTSSLDITLDNAADKEPLSGAEISSTNGELYHPNGAQLTGAAANFVLDPANDFENTNSLTFIDSSTNTPHGSIVDYYLDLQTNAGGITALDGNGDPLDLNQPIFGFHVDTIVDSVTTTTQVMGSDIKVTVTALDHGVGIDGVTIEEGSNGPVVATDNMDGTWSVTFSGLPDGTYDFTVVATDLLGNTKEDTATETLEVHANGVTYEWLNSDGTDAFTGLSAGDLLFEEGQTRNVVLRVTNPADESEIDEITVTRHADDSIIAFASGADMTTKTFVDSKIEDFTFDVSIPGGSTVDVPMTLRSINTFVAGANVGTWEISGMTVDAGTITTDTLEIAGYTVEVPVVTITVEQPALGFSQDAPDGNTHFVNADALPDAADQDPSNDDAITVTVLVEDANQVAFENVDVDLTLDGVAGMLSGITDMNGEFTFTLGDPDALTTFTSNIDFVGGTFEVALTETVHDTTISTDGTESFVIVPTGLYTFLDTDASTVQLGASPTLSSKVTWAHESWDGSAWDASCTCTAMPVGPGQELTIADDVSADTNSAVSGGDTVHADYDLSDEFFNRGNALFAGVMEDSEAGYHTYSAEVTGIMPLGITTQGSNDVSVLYNGYLVTATASQDVGLVGDDIAFTAMAESLAPNALPAGTNAVPAIDLTTTVNGASSTVADAFGSGNPVTVLNGASTGSQTIAYSGVAADQLPVYGSNYLRSFIDVELVPVFGNDAGVHATGANNVLNWQVYLNGALLADDTIEAAFEDNEGGSAADTAAKTVTLTESSFSLKDSGNAETFTDVDDFDGDADAATGFATFNVDTWTGELADAVAFGEYTLELSEVLSGEAVEDDVQVDIYRNQQSLRVESVDGAQWNDELGVYVTPTLSSPDLTVVLEQGWFNGTAFDGTPTGVPGVTLELFHNTDIGAWDTAGLYEEDGAAPTDDTDVDGRAEFPLIHYGQQGFATYRVTDAAEGDGANPTSVVFGHVEAPLAYTQLDVAVDQAGNIFAAVNDPVDGIFTATWGYNGADAEGIDITVNGQTITTDSNGEATYTSTSSVVDSEDVALSAATGFGVTTHNTPATYTVSWIEMVYDALVVETYDGADWVPATFSGGAFQANAGEYVRITVRTYLDDGTG